MGRPKGTPNKTNYRKPPVCEMSTEQRIQLLANLILDRIQAKRAEVKK